MNIKAISDALTNQDFNKLYDIFSKSWFDYDINEEPNMADSIGSLADKLATVDFKMAHNQNILYEVRKMTPEEFTKTWENNLSELHNVLKRCTDLNVQRSRLVDEIDKKLAAMIRGDINPDDLVNNQHKTY